MNPFVVIFTLCCLANTQARPSYGHGGSTIKLEGVPNESHYGKLTYPKFDIIELGSAIKGSLPPAVVEINRKVIIKEPQPYPVKVPVPVPHPVEVAKPYPVVETKIVKVPHPFPVEVIKKIPVPFEVPKPFPVSSDEFKSSQSGASSSYGGIFAGHSQLGDQHINNVQEESQGSGGYDSGYGGGYGGGYSGGYDSGFQGSEHGGGYAEADQSQSYGAQAPVEHPTGWVPVGQDESQQVEEHQQ